MGYSDKVLDHFKNPRHSGKIDDADGIGSAGNPVCGDEMVIYIKVDNDIIKDISFETFGCAAAIASSSMLTEMAIGKSLNDAYSITRNQVAENLDGLPPAKMHCSNLASDALKVAINKYLEDNGRDPLGVVKPHVSTDEDPYH
ncbi:MAG: Fe-S cluster assembly scaffold protein NifU [Candidatus Hodarchaeota archaeon]